MVVTFERYLIHLLLKTTRIVIINHTVVHNNFSKPLEKLDLNRDYVRL